MLEYFNISNVVYCLHCRGIHFKKFGISGTKRNVRNRKVSKSRADSAKLVSKLVRNHLLGKHKR